MDNYNYDSYCGIYCGACDIMMSYNTVEKGKLANFWDERTVKTFQKKIGLHYDENKPFSYRCNGCKSDVLFVNCAVCQIRECAINSKVEHCIDCQKYPCEQIVNSKKLELLLPHLKSNRANMEEIKKVGITQWLDEQENKWKCPRCKTGFSWYTRKCKNCGGNLKKYSFRFSYVLLPIFKLGIYLMPGKKG